MADEHVGLQLDALLLGHLPGSLHRLSVGAIGGLFGPAREIRLFAVTRLD